MNMRSTKHFGVFACFFKRQTSRGDGVDYIDIVIVAKNFEPCPYQRSLE